MTQFVPKSVPLQFVPIARFIFFLSDHEYAMQAA